MDRMGWSVSARLMRRWFASAAWEMSEQEKNTAGPFATYARSRLDAQIVTMAWARRFQRISAAMNALQSEWSWKSDSRELLRLRVGRMQTRMSAPPWRFGDLRADAPTVEDTCQIRFHRVGSTTDPLDDCYGALGRFMVKLAVSGTVKREGQRLVIEVDQVGHYIKDSYDFTGDQFLGLWDRDGVSHDGFASGLSRLGMARQRPIPLARADGDAGAQQDDRVYQVTNQSFRDWRAARGQGGDCFVFSDVAVTNLAAPVRVILDA